MATLAQSLASALSPDPTIRRAAEQHILQLQESPEFGAAALELVSAGGTDPSVRLGAAVGFKNWVKKFWEGDEDTPSKIPDATKNAIKPRLVPALFALLPNPSLTSQLRAAIAQIAATDFPEQWADLLPSLVSAFSPDDWARNAEVLSVAHEVFRGWRGMFRSDQLFTKIAYVLGVFCEPYLQLFKHVDGIFSSPQAAALPEAHVRQLAKTLRLLVALYYDLNCQDIPEYFEDRLSDFSALLLKYLTWSHPALVTSDADEDGEGEPGELEKIRAGICEVVELYSVRYEDVFPQLGQFVETVWGVLGTVGKGQRYDLLVAKATSFLSAAVKLPSQRALFENHATLQAFCDKIILPNMTLRDFEVEMFEDDPAEYARRDLQAGFASTSGGSVGGEEGQTRRGAASAFTRALLELYDREVTLILTSSVQAYLGQYAADRQGNWKAKDAAVSLLSSVASRASTAAAGVTSTNNLVDVVRFFAEHVVQDLEAPAASVHPIIVAGAIKFLYTFRQHLDKPQLLAVIPMLVQQLDRHDQAVIHTYAAESIERVLFIKRDGKLIFTSAETKPFAGNLLKALFALIRKGETPQQIAQNDALMKCVMRTILTVRQGIAPLYEYVLGELAAILVEISKNPSNPKFNHYTFESISALIRFTTLADSKTLQPIESVVFPPFTAILTQDVQEFSPFVFQIISQLLEIHSLKPGPLPQNYTSLLPPILTPTLWESRGNVPALVRLLRGFLSASSASVVQEGRIPAMLGVFQKLIGSKANDNYGFELLETMFEHVPLDALQPYLRSVFMLIFTRMHQSKTDKFVQCFLHTLMMLCALEKPGLDPDVIIGVINAVQPALFAQVMESVILPEVPNASLKRRRVVALGHVALLTRSRSFQSPETAEGRLYLPVLASILRLFTLRLLASDAAEEDVDGVDLEDPGYQAGFSRLGASEVVSRRDLFEAMGDPRDALARGLVRASEAQPGKMQGLIQQVPQEYSAPFLQWLSAGGYQLR